MKINTGKKNVNLANIPLNQNTVLIMECLDFIHAVGSKEDIKEVTISIEMVQQKLIENLNSQTQ